MSAPQGCPDGTFPILHRDRTEGRSEGVIVSDGQFIPENIRRTVAEAICNSHGETMAVPGHLRPEWQIDALREVTTGNTPPLLGFDPNGPRAQGPRGVRSAVDASRSHPVSLAVWVTDDNVLRSAGNYPLTREPRLGVVWSKFRGPGTVTFSEAEPELDTAGKAVTTATFDTPGEYVLRALAWDDSGPQLATMAVGFQCCWTNGYVDVRVE